MPTTSQSVAPQSTHKLSNKLSPGHCQTCLRTISLTSAGVIRKHGPSPGCIGTGQLPATLPSSVAINQQSHSVSQQSQLLPAVINTVTQESSLSLNTASIVELLRGKQLRLLKRIPKASRIQAAEKPS
jgi:hypothetical protein